MHLTTNKYSYPNGYGVEEVAKFLGVTPEEIYRDCQDWQYTYPKLEDLIKYVEIYQQENLSGQGKRVLGCFIFQALEDYLCEGGEESRVVDVLQMLKSDYEVHALEFREWSEMESEDPSNWWYITKIIHSLTDA